MKPRPTLLLVDDDDTFRTVTAGELRRLSYDVVTAGSGAEARRSAAALQPQVVLLDLRLPDANGLDVLQFIRESSPGTEVIVLTGHGAIDTAIESIKLGAFDYLAKPCPLDELDFRLQRALERHSLQKRASLLERGLTPSDPGDAFVGSSPEFQAILQLVSRVAPTPATVLISGETGCGKEMVAKLLHARSQRRQKPFVVVECATLQESLLQSELFGHERGAFTGAERTKAGLFEVAHGGTVFLDEIGEVSLATQVKLLRVMDTSTFRRVGGTTELHVDVRVIAATNRNLRAMVAQGLFREDLYFRLSTITVVIPPLRERRGDIDTLLAHMLRVLNERFGVSRRLSASAAELLRRHEWPGNVRELLHTIEAALIVCDGDEIRPEHLPDSIRAGGWRAAPTEGELLTLEQVERNHIELALRVMDGHRGKAARALGISERNLYRKLGEYRLLD